ncbi:MAG TPA: hypothetical protein VMC43_03625 [Candidatus Paceibacterota bacterium]|nr:hypothetical protein [Candidatus Paceibacterota bacterium]
MCQCGHMWHAHKHGRWIIKLILLVVLLALTFSLGVKFGELRGGFRHGGRGSYSGQRVIMFQNPSSYGYGNGYGGGMMRPQWPTQMPPQTAPGPVSSSTTPKQ